MSGIFKGGAYHPLGSGTEMSEGEYQAALADDDLSEHAQDARDFDYDGDMQEARRANLESFLDGPFPGEWVTRDARVLKIADMTTSHLDNAVRYFERAGLGEHPKVLELKQERGRR